MPRRFKFGKETTPSRCAFYNSTINCPISDSNKCGHTNNEISMMPSFLTNSAMKQTLFESFHINEEGYILESALFYHPKRPFRFFPTKYF